MANPGRVPGKRGYQPTPAHVLARAPVFEDYLTGEPITVPAGTVDWYSQVTDWPMYLNDRLGDCTIAAPGHFFGAMSMYAGSSPALPTFSDEAITTAYSGVTSPPYDPATGANDNGAVPGTVCEYLHTTGMTGEAGKTHTLAAWGDWPSRATGSTSRRRSTCAAPSTWRSSARTARSSSSATASRGLGCPAPPRPAARGLPAARGARRAGHVHAHLLGRRGARQPRLHPAHRD